jgi:hypothetical protein
MKRVLLLGVLWMGLMNGFAEARGFGGGAIAAAGSIPAGEGIGGTGALWTDGIMGAGGLWADGAYGNGLPGYEGAFGAGAAYGGFFSGPPQLAMKHPESYNPLAGEQQAIGGAQLNVNAQRRNFVRSLAGMGIGTGGFQPGEFGPPPGSKGLPSDMGMHQAGGTGAYGYARSGRGTPAANADGTRDWAAADLRVFGNAARSDFRDYSVFGRDWFTRYPRAWNTRGYVRDVWVGPTWADVDNWLGGELPNYQYTYGSDLVYDGNTVYLCGRPVAAADKYYDSAVSITRSGTQVQNARAAGEWLPLGVFEAIRSGQKSSPMLFQLAVNRAGIIRGNYFDTTDKNVQTVEGAVDKDTQRAAWVVADKTSVVFDCVLYNLTRAETPVLVHMGPDKNEQWIFVRLAREEAGR